MGLVIWCLELQRLYQSCHIPNWDGHGAAPMSEGTLVHASQLVRNLRGKAIHPCLTVGVEPDGCATLEWAADSSHVISVSINETDWVDYAWLFGEQKSHGRVRLKASKDLPQLLLIMIREVVKFADAKASKAEEEGSAGTSVATPAE